MSDGPSIVPSPPESPIDPLGHALKEVFGEYVSPAKIERVRELLKAFGVTLEVKR
jgi:hypothetical protein